MALKKSEKAEKKNKILAAYFLKGYPVGNLFVFINYQPCYKKTYPHNLSLHQKFCSSCKRP